jgi:hypothetical protein
MSADDFDAEDELCRVPNGVVWTVVGVVVAAFWGGVALLIRLW